MNYIDFVIVNVNGSKRLYVAPEFSHLRKGDRVVINDHSEPFLVVASDSFIAEDNDSTAKMILETFEYDSISEVPKVVARVDIIKFDWDKKEVKKNEE